MNTNSGSYCIVRTVCRCRHSSSDQKLIAAGVLNMISQPASSTLTPAPPSSPLPLYQAYEKDRKLCTSEKINIQRSSSVSYPDWIHGVGAAVALVLSAKSGSKCRLQKSFSRIKTLHGVFGILSILPKVCTLSVNAL